MAGNRSILLWDRVVDGVVERADLRLAPKSGHRLGGFLVKGAAGEDVLDGIEEAEELYLGVSA